MSYNINELPHYVKTAGKISILATVISVCVFLFALMVDVGNQELQKVSAQTGVATTSLTVVNTPPVFVAGPFEVIESSTTTPTNSGDDVQWGATATDANGAPYFFLVCNTNASPTANAAPNLGSLGTAPPECGVGAVQWAVSGAVPSGDPVVISTTTIEFADNASTPFAETNDWYAWVCDDDPTQPACSPIPQQGVAATNSSPFNMNQRPVLTAAGNDGPVDPASLLTFLSTSSDPDSVGGADTVEIIVCQSNANYSTTTNSCTDEFASSTAPFATDATAAYTTPSIIRDQSYAAFVYLVDNHGHEASAPLSADFTINNVAPTVVGGDINLNEGSNIILTELGEETTGFTLDFTVSDANSCVNTTGTPGSEIPGYEISLYRSPTYSTTTDCNPQAGQYDPNYCYSTGVATTTWNLSCTASTTSCTGATDDSLIYNCTFPMWFVSDPTDGGPYIADEWVAAVAGGDDNFATSSLVATDSPVEVQSLTGLSLESASIPYGDLAPGEATPTLSASTTIANIGNTGIDQNLDGSAMCPEYVSTSSDCTGIASSTIFTNSQRFASSSVVFTSPDAQLLSTTSVLTTELELDVRKTTATSSDLWSTGITYWGIEVPAAITVAGAYTGQNTFYARIAEDADWE